MLHVCQARWKSGAPFLSYKQKRFSKKTDKSRKKLYVFAGEMYLTIYVEWVKDHLGIG